TQVYPANHALRAVRVPAGEHTVEFRYESWSLRIGIAITLCTLTVILGLLAAALVRWSGARHASPPEGLGTRE
ncbi:MAG: hypothetical protein M3506_07370, partial [Chloroflexota bacterium]|nr:hypothetical protein [Chloroflexota bacterium]